MNQIMMSRAGRREIELLTGVAVRDGESVSALYERGFNFYEYFMFNETVNTSLLSPRLKLRYLQISCLMHYTKKSVSQVLTMRMKDLDNLVTSLKKKSKGKIASENGAAEIGKLFKSPNGEDAFHLLFHAPNKPHAPLSKAKVIKTFLELTEKMEEPIDTSYDVA